MRSVSKTLAIEASMGEGGALGGGGGGAGARGTHSASLSLGVDSDTIRIRTFFRDLRRDDAAGLAPPPPRRAGDAGGGNTAGATVLLRDFSRTLRGIAALPRPVSTTLAIVPELALFLHLILEDGTGSATIIHSLVDRGGALLDEEDEAAAAAAAAAGAGAGAGQGGAAEEAAALAMGL
jgi:hypothetical protein